MSDQFAAKIVAELKSIGETMEKIRAALAEINTRQARQEEILGRGQK